MAVDVKESLWFAFSVTAPSGQKYEFGRIAINKQEALRVILEDLDSVAVELRALANAKAASKPS